MMKLRTSFIWILIGGFALFVFYYSGELERVENSKIIGNGKTTIGTIYWTGGQNLKCKYKIEGKEYIFSHGNPLSYLRDGEEYYIKYLPSNPESIVIEFGKPFLSGQYSYLSAKPLNVNKLPWANHVFNFEYRVGQEVFKRQVVLEDENESVDIENYSVRYREDYPLIAYLVKK